MIGQTVLNDFRITKKIGSGAFATVYLAQQRHVDRQVVVKVTHAHLLDGAHAEMIESRYQAEIKAAARVQHPNLVTIHTAGHIDRLPAVVMEYIQGRTLAHWLSEQAPLYTEMRPALFEQIGSALLALHEEGVIHRDVNPRNIMISPKANGTFRAVVLDFGVAQLDGSTQHTMGPLGTPRYMAPEQAQGKATTASDVYSLGVMLWWAYTGHRYLEQYDNFAEIFQHQLEHATPEDPRLLVPEMPRALSTIIRKMLTPEASLRPSMGQFLEFWRAYHDADRDRGQFMRPITGQFTGLMREAYSQVSEFSLSEPSSFGRELYIFDTGEADVLVKTTTRMLASEMPCEPLESLWDLTQGEASPQRLLLCVQNPQAGLMTLGMIEEMGVLHDLCIVTPDAKWSASWADHVRHPVFRLPAQTSALLRHLRQTHVATRPGLAPLSGASISNASISLINSPEHSIDEVLLTSRNGTRPLEMQGMIDTFIGKMPQLLSQMEGQIQQPDVVILCCQEIEDMALPLGMKRIARLSKMIRGFAEHDMLETMQGPYEELEDAYHEGFQELIKLRASP